MYGQILYGVQKTIRHLNESGLSQAFSLPGAGPFKPGRCPGLRCIRLSAFLSINTYGVLLSQ